MQQITVSLGQRSYPIEIGPGLLREARRRLEALPVKRWAVIADENTAALYAGALDLPVYTFPAGEGSKRLAVYEDLCRRLLADGFTRQDGIAALGGGVTGDLAGFIAGTLLRGVALAQLPTSLLAQVDSSVGGKTGLDLPEGKTSSAAFTSPGWCWRIRRAWPPCPGGSCPQAWRRSSSAASSATRPFCTTWKRRSSRIFPGWWRAAAGIRRRWCPGTSGTAAGAGC